MKSESHHGVTDFLINLVVNHNHQEGDNQAAVIDQVVIPHPLLASSVRDTRLTLENMTSELRSILLCLRLTEASHERGEPIGTAFDAIVFPFLHSHVLELSRRIGCRYLIAVLSTLGILLSERIEPVLNTQGKSCRYHEDVEHIKHLLHVIRPSHLFTDV